MRAQQLARKSAAPTGTPSDQLAVGPSHRIGCQAAQSGEGAGPDQRNDDQTARQLLRPRRMALHHSGSHQRGSDHCRAHRRARRAHPAAVGHHQPRHLHAGTVPRRPPELGGGRHLPRGGTVRHRLRPARARAAERVGSNRRRCHPTRLGRRTTRGVAQPSTRSKERVPDGHGRIPRRCPRRDHRESIGMELAPDDHRPAGPQAGHHLPGRLHGRGNGRSPTVTRVTDRPHRILDAPLLRHLARNFPGVDRQ